MEILLLLKYFHVWEYNYFVFGLNVLYESAVTQAVMTVF
jgi:hypothetical protein